MDLTPIINDDEAVERWRDALAAVFEPSVVSTMRLPGMAPVGYSGMDGLLSAWRDWLKHWESYRDEIEDVIDDGDRVVVVHRFNGRPRQGAPETTHKHATVWTVRDGRIACVDFNVPYEEALTTSGPAN
ncbi:MAG TPA: nuclear transport factor 2 family protein [Solirubrobacteraceae bacterium]|nr:nuclear transport factor 2 family protein [Solirubrobacteraceae bacterium]